MRMRGKDVVWETMAGIKGVSSSWEYDLRVSRILGDGEHTPRSIHRAILDLAADVRLRNAAPVERGKIGPRSAVGQTVRRKIDAPRGHSRRIGCANRIGTRVA